MKLQMMRLRDRVDVLRAWWEMYGQFSAPVRAVSPRRRRQLREVRELTERTDFAAVRLEWLQARMDEAVANAVAATGEAEAELFERIFDHPIPSRHRETP